MLRVLRVIEYTYEDAETFAEDQLNWSRNYKTSKFSYQSEIVSITSTKKDGAE